MKIKYENVKYTAVAEYSDGTLSNCRVFATHKALSNWVNKQFAIDEGVKVTVWDGFTDRIITEYSA